MSEVVMHLIKRPSEIGKQELTICGELVSDTDIATDDIGLVSCSKCVRVIDIRRGKAQRALRAKRGIRCLVLSGGEWMEQPDNFEYEESPRIEITLQGYSAYGLIDGKIEYMRAFDLLDKAQTAVWRSVNRDNAVEIQRLTVRVRELERIVRKR